MSVVGDKGDARVESDDADDDDDGAGGDDISGVCSCKLYAIARTGLGA